MRNGDKDKISEKSVAIYTQKANHLIRKAFIYYQLSENDQLKTDQIKDYMITNRKKWMYSTWRLYRRSIIHHAETTDDFDAEYLRNSFEGYEPKETREIDKSKKRKAKHIYENDFNEMISYLEKKKARTCLPKLAILYMKASIVAGQRPEEWESAILDGNELTLKNFKRSDIRAHGEFRTIELPVESQQLEDVKNFILALNNYISEEYDKKSDDPEKSELDIFKKAMESIRQQIKGANTKLFPRRKFSICRYTLRHQFCADLKATGKTAEEVAALMGHRSVITAFKHYGRKSKGISNRVTANASAADVEKVKQLNNINNAEANNSPKTPLPGEKTSKEFASLKPENQPDKSTIKLPNDIGNRLKDMETNIERPDNDPKPRGPKM